MCAKVLPHGGERQTEETLLALMSGARLALDAAGCALVGGHTCEGAELALGFAINGVGPASSKTFMSKVGLKPGDVLVLTKPLGTGAIFAGDMRAKARARDVGEALRSMCQPNKAAAEVRFNGIIFQRHYYYFQRHYYFYNGFLTELKRCATAVTLSSLWCHCSHCVPLWSL